MKLKNFYYFIQLFRDNPFLSKERIVIIGWFGFVCMISFYWIWGGVFPQPYENLIIRVVGACLFLPAAFRRFVPERYEPYLIFSLYTALMYSIPFFFTFMILKNLGSTVWLMTGVCGIFLMHMVAGWQVVVFMISFGVILGSICYYVFTPHAGFIPPTVLVSLPVFVFAWISAIVFNVIKETIVREKIKAMFGISSAIAHELRTPLLSVESTAKGIQRYLPMLLELYQDALKQGKNLPVMRANQLQLFLASPQRISDEVRRMQTTIDLLLTNVDAGVRKADQLQIVDVARVISDAIEFYPFNAMHQRNCVIFEKNETFLIEAQPQLLSLIITNLLKNALKATATVNKPSIVFAINVDKRKILVKDNGVGIPAHVLPHIFERFFSYPQHGGNGIGLAFCKETLEKWGGSIECISAESEGCEFHLSFENVS